MAEDECVIEQGNIEEWLRTPPNRGCLCGQPDCNRWWGIRCQHGDSIAADVVQVIEYIHKWGPLDKACVECKVVFKWDDELWKQYTDWSAAQGFPLEYHEIDGKNGDPTQYCSTKCFTDTFKVEPVPPPPTLSVTEHVKAMLEDFGRKNEGRAPKMIVMSRASLTKLYMDSRNMREDQAKHLVSKTERDVGGFTVYGVPVLLSPRAKNNVIATDKWP